MDAKLELALHSGTTYDVRGQYDKLRKLKIQIAKAMALHAAGASNEGATIDLTGHAYAGNGTLHPVDLTVRIDQLAGVQLTAPAKQDA